MTNFVTDVLQAGSNAHPTTSQAANSYSTDLLTDGVVGEIANTSGAAPMTGAFAVNATGTPDANVQVTAGVCYSLVTPTSQASQRVRTQLSATQAVAIASNSTGSTRYDFLYVSLSAANAANPSVSGDNVATLATSRSTSASTDNGPGVSFGYLIAIITVANGFSTITNGNISDQREQVSVNANSVTVASTGWQNISTVPSVASGYNKGQKEFDLTFSGVDLSSTLSPGMRFKLLRGTTPGTMCFDAESSSSHYANKTSPTGFTFTDDFACEKWVMLESYPVAGQTMLSRYNGTSGFEFTIDSAGRVAMTGYNAGAANFRGVNSYQSIPLGKWVHVAAQLDMSAHTATSTTSYVMIDGADVPANVYQGGTNPAALIQAGNLEIGGKNGGTTPFDGKMSDGRIWGAKRTQTQIRDNMNQALAGNESNLVFYAKLNGNFNDSTANANNLTGQNGAVATTVDHPHKATEYGIITKVAYSSNTTVTVFTGTSHNIPNETLGAASYSTDRMPYGFPGDRGKWTIDVMRDAALRDQTAPSASTWYNPNSALIGSIPTGVWDINRRCAARYFEAAATGTAQIWSTLSTANNTESHPDLTGYYDHIITSVASHQTVYPHNLYSPGGFVATAMTSVYLNVKTAQSSIDSIGINGTLVQTLVQATCAYL